MSEPHDSELEEELRLLATRDDPLPAGLVAAAVEAFGWRDADSELAALVYDSLLDEDEAALVRGEGERRLVSFRAGELTLDLEVTSTGPGRVVMGQVEPPQLALVDIRRRQGAVSIATDELGRFQTEALPAGPVSLRLRHGGAARPPVVTEWITL